MALWCHPIVGGARVLLLPSPWGSSAPSKGGDSLPRSRAGEARLQSLPARSLSRLHPARREQRVTEASLISLIITHPPSTCVMFVRLQCFYLCLLRNLSPNPRTAKRMLYSHFTDDETAQRG